MTQGCSWVGRGTGQEGVRNPHPDTFRKLVRAWGGMQPSNALPSPQRAPSVI